MKNEILVAIAQHEIGVSEVRGVENNPRILHYSKRADLNWVKDDETSWCGIFLAFCVSELPEFLRPKGFPKANAATARKWLDEGAEVSLEEAKPGDVLVFWRGSPDSWMGHCTLFMGKKNENTVYGLGGNQSNQVSIAEYSLDRLLGIRRL
jgi:uncharacterized protein (TIGR02594 family)